MNNKAKVIINNALESPPGKWVEVGCIRFSKEIPTDGYSTYYLAKEAVKNNVSFFSFDIDEERVKKANEHLKDKLLGPVVECQNGSDAVGQMGSISFLYLDGGNNPAEIFKQYLAASLVPGGRVVVDDCQKRGCDKYGKGSILIESLRTYGVQFNIVDVGAGYKMLQFCLVEGKRQGTIK